MSPAILPIPTAPSSTLPPETIRKVTKAAQDFEAMALGQFLAPMFETLDQSKSPFGGGAGEAPWRSMMVTELAKGVAQHGGLGLARPIMQQMLKLQEAAQAGADPK